MVYLSLEGKVVFVNKGKTKKESKPKYNMGQNTWFMAKLAWTSGEKKVLVLSLLSALLAVALNLVNLYLSPMILSAVENRASVQELILTIVIFIFALMLLSAASEYINSNTLFGRISVRTEIINLLNRKAATTSYSNVFDDKFTKLLAKSEDCTCNNNVATEAIWGTLTRLTTNILGFIIYVALLSSVQPLLIVVILVTTAISYFVNRYANGYGYRHREEEAEFQKQMSYITNQSKRFDKAKDIRLFGLRPWLDELFEKALQAYIAFQRKSQGISVWARVVDLVLAFLRNGIAYAYLIGLVLNNGLTVSEFLLFFSTVGGFTSWVTGILNGFNTLYRQSLDISTVRECLTYPEPFRFEDGEPLPENKRSGYELQLRDVSYRYPNSEEYTLEHINLTLHAGEKLAVVGLNGAGKTTLVKLLCGFLDPTEGEVLLNGEDIRKYNRQEYYTLFSAVFQDFSLLAGTIAANIAQNEDDINMERVKYCADKAGLVEKIESLSDGYETKLNRAVYEDAILLSGGETQRLMLARALYKDAPFVILDEPTAALDPIAESDMYQKYNEMTVGKSSVYISHRLASTRFCDRIIMIVDGGIKEEGTHHDLLAKGGKYAELYEIQSRYYREGGSENEETE